jgi:hypothetical protein
MTSKHQEFFERCCNKRLQTYTERTALKQVAQSHAVLAYLDQWCLSCASKRCLEKADLHSLECFPFDLLRNLPKHPIWVTFVPPQPAYCAGTARNQEAQIAAAFFYALESPEILRRAFVPPITSRPWHKSDPLTPAWWQWQLDLMALDGTVLTDYRYTYDQRTAQWQKLISSTCPWNQCEYSIDENLEQRIVMTCCNLCQKSMDYYSSWLATLLHHHLGQKLRLKNTAFDSSKKQIFAQKRAERILRADETSDG